MHHQNIVTPEQVGTFVSQHGLPGAFRTLITEHYDPLVSWLMRARRPGQQTFLGINGAQGTGKSTLADFLRFVLEANADWRVAALSLDDFYLTKAERRQLGEEIHPLLRTRGVPGTHDMQMLADYLARLRSLDEFEAMSLPRFDKANDDRADSATWPVVNGPIDLVILEGWCVGSRPQQAAELAEPVNALERDQDAAGVWRRHVNSQLDGLYADVFADLDLLIFLQAPGFDAIYRWRLEQEQKLAAAAADGGEIMSEEQVAEFIQHFERITRANLFALPDIADVTLQLDDGHDCVLSTYRQ